MIRGGDPKFLDDLTRARRFPEWLAFRFPDFETRTNGCAGMKNLA